MESPHKTCMKTQRVREIEPFNEIFKNLLLDLTIFRVSKVRALTVIVNGVHFFVLMTRSSMVSSCERLIILL